MSCLLLNVSVHVRRTDKLESEAKFHDFSEYMTHVAEFYDIQKARNINQEKIKQRCVFVASDDRFLLDKLKSDNEFGHNYQFSVAEYNANSNIESRIKFDNLEKTIIDIMKLANADFLVCTFSSNLCRLAYELMQTKHHGDASWRFNSLDDIYYFHGIDSPLYTVSKSYMIV